MRTRRWADAGVPCAPLHTLCFWGSNLVSLWPAMLLALLPLAAKSALWCRTCLAMMIAGALRRLAPDRLLSFLGPEIAVIEAALWCATGEPELSSHTSNFCPEVMVFGTCCAS